MSRRAIRQRIRRGRPAIATPTCARSPTAPAPANPRRAVLAHALRAWDARWPAPIRDFGADVIVVGGSMSASWDLFEAWFREGADDVAVPPVHIAADRDTAPLFGAAYVATPSR